MLWHVTCVVKRGKQLQIAISYNTVHTLSCELVGTTFIFANQWIVHREVSKVLQYAATYSAALIAHVLSGLRTVLSHVVWRCSVYVGCAATLQILTDCAGSCAFSARQSDGVGVVSGVWCLKRRVWRGG